jgi:K+-sensing histidine kinase KdpD
VVFLLKKLQKKTDQLEKASTLILQQNNNLSELNTTKETILSFIGHDLRGQLHQSMAALKQFKNHNKTFFNAHEERNLSKAINAQMNCFDLANNLFLWATHQSEKIAVSVEPLYLDQLIQSQIKALVWHEEVEVNLPQGKWRIYSDKFLINTVFRNLISNAVKYKKANTKVKINLQNKDNHLLLFIINEIAQPSVLQKEFSDSKELLVSGHGMGLVIVKQFCELLQIEFNAMLHDSEWKVQLKLKCGKSRRKSIFSK